MTLTVSADGLSNVLYTFYIAHWWSGLGCAPLPAGMRFQGRRAKRELDRCVSTVGLVLSIFLENFFDLGTVTNIDEANQVQKVGAVWRSNSDVDRP
jgi:hypothetical protein